jgi:hypothetical protein
MIGSIYTVPKREKKIQAPLQDQTLGCTLLRRADARRETVTVPIRPLDADSVEMFFVAPIPPASENPPRRPNAGGVRVVVGGLFFPRFAPRKLPLGTTSGEIWRPAQLDALLVDFANRQEYARPTAIGQRQRAPGRGRWLLPDARCGCFLASFSVAVTIPRLN